jgi:peptidyl-prolyl cis-trans isomerase D
MSIIQTIRDRAWIIVAAIAIALIAFIVQDAFQGGGGMGLFGGQSTTIGKVDGKKIEIADFDTKYKQIEENYQAQGYPVDDNLRNSLREQLWNQFVEEAVLSDDYEAIGLKVTSAERSDMLYGSNPPQQLRQAFTDSTGNYNAALAYQRINEIKKGTPQYDQFWGEFIPELEKARIRDKFTALLGKSAYVPKWMVEKINTENSQRSNISIVQVPYASISDSLIKVTDEDIKKYLDEHSKMFQQEATRGISYVMFDAGPSKADSQEIYTQLEKLKDSFATAQDPQTFLVSNNSEMPYLDGYTPGSKIQMENADTLRKLPVGAIYGPYLDGSNYVVAKKIAQRRMPDSVSVRHILIKIRDQQAGQIRTDSAAKQLIDSIVDAYRAGTPFDTLASKLSEDQGSSQNGGKYNFSYTQTNLSKEFYDVCFYGNTGDKKTIKVDNASYTGYHYMEVLNQKNIEESYKIAYLSRPMDPSDQTVNSANGLASQFVAESRTYQQFEANAKKKNLNVFNAPDIKPLDNMIMGVGASRELVKWIYKADKGDVAETPFMVGDKFVVPVLTQIYEKGIMSVEKARPMVEPRVRNEKKAEQIVKKIGNASTLEAVAQATGQTIQKIDSLAFSAMFVPNVGQEMKLLGAAFNPNFQSKISAPIKGEAGVFVIKVENISAVPNPLFDAAQTKKGLEMQQENAAFRLIEAMKKSAKIVDNRATYY